MTNRKQRRAEAAEIAKLPPIPNISGTDESCGNCYFAPKAAIVHNQLLRRVEAVPKDETLCMRFPGGNCGMKMWGWCGEWKEAK